MLRNEPTGMELVFEVDKVNHEETLIHTYKGDRSREIAGEVMSKSRTRSSTVILPRKDHLSHTSAGFELVKPLGGNLGLYTRTDTPSEGYQKGVFSMGNAEVEGTLIKPADRDTSGNGPILLPVVQGGRIVAYRAVMDHKTRELDAGMNIGAAESLGNHGGRTHRLSKGNSFNKQIVDIAYGDYLANGRDTKAFIKISTESSNPQVREFARLIPKEMRKDIETQWGGDMYLRKNQLDLMIGFRKMALVDKVNEKLVSSGRGEMNAAFSGSVRLAGDVWQGLVGEVKKRTVLFTPAVVIGNFTSNLAVSLLHGMNPVDIVRDQAEGLRAIRAYTKWQDEVAALDLEIKLGKDVESNTRQRKAVQDAMKSSGIHELIEAGMFQTIVEDIDISEGSQGALGLLADKVLPESFSSKAEETYMKAPDSVKTGLGVLMLSPSTQVGANIQAATAYSDFMARYAMFKHLKKKGEPTGKAINEVMDVYVDYAPNTSKEMQYNQ